MLTIADLASLIEEYQIPVVKVDEDRGYWLIRTQSGEYFDEFHLGGFIGIGWNDYNEPEDFRESRKELTQARIEDDIEGIQAWRVFTQLRRFFHDMKIGDIVMIPSANSKYIVFGEVTSDVYFEEIDEEALEENECPHVKRRSVTWKKIVERKALDPYLYKMMQSHFSISNAREYADAIDRTLHSYYYKGDKAHLILSVEQSNDIPLVDLLDALNAPLELLDIINDFDGQMLNYNRRDLDAKLRVQSPGMIEFVSSGHAFGLVILLGITIVGLVGGNLSVKRKGRSGTETEGSLQSDGLLEKILKWRQQSHEHEMEGKLLEVDESQLDTMQEAQNKLLRAKRTLRMKMPSELSTEEDVAEESADTENTSTVVQVDLNPEPAEEVTEEKE